MPGDRGGGPHFSGSNLDVTTGNIGQLNAAVAAIQSFSGSAVANLNAVNAYVPPGGFSKWNTALAKAAAGTGTATVWSLGASIAGLGAGGTAVSDVMTKPYGAVWRAAKRAAGYTTHGDSFLPMGSSSFNSVPTFSVYPWTMNVSPAAWSFTGPFISPLWATQTTIPLCSATHPSTALGYNARSCSLFYWGSGTQDGGPDWNGRTFSANIDGGSNTNITNLGGSLIYRQDFTNLTDAPGHVLNIGNQGAASSAFAPIAVSWYPTVTVPTSGIHYAWFGYHATATLHDLRFTGGTGPALKIERFMGPSNAAALFAPSATLSPPFAPDLAIIDGYDDIISLPGRYTSSSTPSFTATSGNPSTYLDGMRRLAQVLRRKSTGCNLVFHWPAIADSVVSDTNSLATTPSSTWTYKPLLYAEALSEGYGWLDSDAEWGELGLNLGFLQANNPHPTNAGHADIAARLTSRLGL